MKHLTMVVDPVSEKSSDLALKLRLDPDQDPVGTSRFKIYMKSNFLFSFYWSKLKYRTDPEPTACLISLEPFYIVGHYIK